MDQYFFLISGKAKLITKSLDSSTKNETHLTQGSLAYIPRNTAFVTIAEKESILLEFSPQEFDPSNPDINKFELVS
jgi:mannose-6-phosphate isomerase-like protein (cupin superfamily)